MSRGLRQVAGSQSDCCGEVQITDSYQRSTCTCHCATLFHWVAGASRSANESDRLLCMSTRSYNTAYFPADGVRQQFFVLRQCPISCDRHRQMCRSTPGGFPALALHGDFFQFHCVLPERAVGVTALPWGDTPFAVRMLAGGPILSVSWKVTRG